MNDSRLCSLHQKHIEAFCIQDLTLLCINCILQGGHKTHQFFSVNDAVKSEQELFYSQQNQQIENQIKSMNYLQDLHDYAKNLTSAQEKQLTDITKFFIEIKKQVNDREQYLKVKVHDTVQKEFNMVRQANIQLQELIQQIAIYQYELNSIGQVEDEIDFLNNAEKRHQILSKIKTQIKYPELKIKLVDLNRESETNIIIKSLLSMKLVVNKRHSQGKKYAQQVHQSCKDINLFKKQSVKEKRVALGESASSLSSPTPQKNIVSINLSKKPQQDCKQQSKTLRLTNLHEARSIIKERSQERQYELAHSYDYKSSTPGRLMKSQSKLSQITHDLSPTKNKVIVNNRFNDNISSTSQHDSFGQQGNLSLPHHDDSIKNDYGTFLNSHVSDGEISCVNRNDISQLYQNMNYTFLTLGGFVDSFVDPKSQLIEKYDPKKEQPEEYDKMKTNRAKFGVVQLQCGNILIMGGKSDGVRVSTCEEYSVKDKEYVESKIKLNSQRSGFGVVLVNEIIFTVGGNDGLGAINSVDCYNQQSQKWFKCASMHDKRDELAVVHGSDNNIYAVGGFGGNFNTCLTSCERYVISRNYWEPISSMSIPRRASAAVSMPDGIYSIGGFNGSSYLSSVERYDDQLDRWQQIVQLNSPRCTLSAVSTPDNLYIYVFGGFDNGPLDKVERYSVLNDSWEPCPQMLAKRFMHQTLLLMK